MLGAPFSDVLVEAGEEQLADVGLTCLTGQAPLWVHSGLAWPGGLHSGQGHLLVYSRHRHRATRCPVIHHLPILPPFLFSIVLGFFLLDSKFRKVM